MVSCKVKGCKNLLLEIPFNKRKLNSTAFPTENLPDGGLNTKSLEREERAVIRNRKRTVLELLRNNEQENCPPDQEIQEEIIAINARDMASQTEYDMESMRELKIMQLEKKLKEKNMQIEKLTESNLSYQRLENSLEMCFSKGQIRKLKLENPKQRIKWDLDDISSAISLHSVGPRAYRYMRKKNYPLPCTSTLRKWASTITVQPGILNDVIKLMEKQNYSEFQRFCVLSFDEMSIKSIYEYDKSNDTVLPPSKKVQVVMARGLFEKWKQPIFYNYDCNITKDLVNTIIVKLSSANFRVVAIVSDMGGSNQGLWKELEITTTRTWITLKEEPDVKIFVFADVPHLLKLIRNHFLDTGFDYKGRTIGVNIIKELVDVTSKSDLRISHKITDLHLTVKQSERQKVKLAAQLLSNTTASCLRRCFQLGKMQSDGVMECADFIKSVNDWFDVFNSKVSSKDSRGRVKAFGLAFDEQIQILHDMTDIMLNIRVPMKTSLLLFQRGIIISNSSLMGLFTFLKDKYGITFLLTNRLNQDVLENFFSAIRWKGALHDHPSALEFKYRLRSYLLGDY